MIINREKFLDNLNMVKAGLSAREFLEQSSCFCFQDGMVMTFNDEISCRIKIGFDIVGAVQSSTLLGILEKLEDEELKVVEHDGELEFRGPQKKFGVTKDAEIHLPIDRVDLPKEWKPLNPKFAQAIGLVRHCVSKDETEFKLTCVHLHADHIEACDNLQIMRCKVKTGMKESVLVRGRSIEHILGLAVDEFAVTKSWLHFRNQAGLIFSCRLFTAEYPLLDKLFTIKGHKVVIPKGLSVSTDRASVFATDKASEPVVTVDLGGGDGDYLVIEGRGLTGWYKERRKVDYSGPAMKFLIAPDLLKHVSDKYDDAIICEDKLKVMGDDDGETWEYVTVLEAPGEKEEPSDKEDDAK